eukprot:m.19827 g.19827  ORF g.19827 m.19827 type:complete len:708 (+) comp27911_c0_seq1:300-2423(+)
MRASKVKKQVSKRSPRKLGPALAQGEGPADEEALPQVFVYFLLLLSVAIRVSVGFNKENWWQLHADEVYQSLEVAHIDLYGYGFLAYEFGGVPPEDATLSVIEEANRKKGMHAMRSVIAPKIYKWAIQVGLWIDPTATPLLISKVFHSILTGLLPCGVMLFTLSLFRGCEWMAFFSASLAAVSEPLIVLGTHTLINSFVSPFLFVSLAVVSATLNRIGIGTSQQNDSEPALQLAKNRQDVLQNGISKTEEDTVTVSKIRSRREKIWLPEWQSLISFGSASCLGTVCYIRVDILLFLFVFFGVMHFPVIHLVFKGFRTLVHLGLGFCLGICFGGFVDFFFYGHWFISPTQWFKFNVHKDLASEVFGSHSWLLYVRNILINDPIFLAFLVAAVAGIIYTVAARRSFSPQTKTASKLFLCLLILFVIYSMKGHKEVRFLHDWIVLAIVFAGVGLSFAIKTMFTSRLNQWVAVVTLVTLFAASSYHRFPRQRYQTNERWAYKRVAHSGCINVALEWVGRQPDATGVFVDHDVYGFAGYTVLRRPIPIIAKMNKEFREWDTVSGRPGRSNLASRNGFVNATSFDDFDLWVTLDNVGRLVKHLLMTPKYNYAVVPKDRQFFKEGFTAIIQVGPVMVFRRDTSEKMVNFHYKLSQKIPYGPNGAVLEEEGTILYNSGFYKQAIERLTAALLINPKRKDLEKLVTDAKTKLDNDN